MVILGTLAATLLPPSLTLLLFHLSSSQDVAREASGEQQLCALREHPTVAFAGESQVPLSPLCNDGVLEGLGLSSAGSLWPLEVLGWSFPVQSGDSSSGIDVRTASMGWKGLILVSNVFRPSLYFYLGRRSLSLGFLC